MGLDSPDRGPKVVSLRSSPGNPYKPKRKRGKIGMYLVAIGAVILFVEAMQFKVSVQVTNEVVSPQRRYEEVMHNRTVLTFKKSTRKKTVARDLRNNTKIAFTISITECPEGDDNGIIQGAAILSHNIKLISAVKHPTAQYVHRLYAFVVPEAKRCGMIIAAYGWKVLWKEVPFEMPDLDGNTRDLMKMKKHVGCCGANEYIKLHSYTLTEYPLVVHLDLDTVLLKPLDNLFDRMLKPAGRALPDVPTVHPEAKDSKQIDFFYTRDYRYDLNASMTRDASKRSVQGAFFVVRPNQTVFDDMLRVLKATGFSNEEGWDKKLYGTGDVGAIAVPGFMSYYYGEHYPKDRAVELDPCIYNTYAYDLRYYDDDPTKCRTGQATCDDCSATPYENIVSAHFGSMCHHPWKCPKYVGSSGERPLCQKMHLAWHRVREQFDVVWNQAAPPRGGWGRNNTLGYCRGTGRRSFMHVPIPHALQGMP